MHIFPKAMNRKDSQLKYIKCGFTQAEILNVNMLENRLNAFFLNAPNCFLNLIIKNWWFTIKH